jgi:parallel beta-helix repeat protein
VNTTKSLFKHPAKLIHKYRRFLVVPVFTIIGVSILIYVRAAPLSIGFEAESGSTLSISDPSASGGRAVKFSSATVDSWPGPDDYKVCGTTILNNPNPAPVGAIIVNPGTDLVQLTNNSVGGSTFYLTKGTHTFPSGYINAKSGNTYIGEPGAIIDGQNKINDSTRSTAIRGGTNVTIKYLTIKNFSISDSLLKKNMVNQTAINWSQGSNWTISNSTISYNGGSGLWAGDNGVVTNNCIAFNQQTGFNVPSKGGTNYSQHFNVLLEGNEIHSNNPDSAVENLGVCTGCAGGLKVWNSRNVTIRNNNVHDNNGNGIWVDNNNIDILIEGNVSKDNTKRGIFYEISYSAIIRNNYITGNYAASGGSVNNAAIYISESGGDLATSNYLGSDQTKFPVEISIYNNYIVDNWHGITLWESANRYCATYIVGGSNNKNDTKWCPPLIMGKTETEKQTNLTKCINDLANNADLCRWKTKNVKVRSNTFEMTSASRIWCPTTSTSCANVAITASTDAPAGTPYAGTIVRDNITKNQNNKFSTNTYIGKWNYYIPSSVGTLLIWKSTPYFQDVDSIFR